MKKRFFLNNIEKMQDFNEMKDIAAIFTVKVEFNLSDICYEIGDKLAITAWDAHTLSMLDYEIFKERLSSKNRITTPEGIIRVYGKKVSITADEFVEGFELINIYTSSNDLT